MPKPRRALVSLLAACALAVAAPLAFTPAAEACMAVRARPGGGPTGVIDQAGEKVLFIQDGTTVTAHIQVQYFGDASDFSWIVPVPSVPTLGVGSDELFTALREATRPRFDLSYRTEGQCKERPPSNGAPLGRASRPAAAPGAAASADAGVTIVSQAAVGPFDTTVLSAEDVGSLRRWLEANEYQVPEKLDAATADYITSRYYFVAMKLQKDRETGDLQPIVLKYEGEKPSLPIRLASVSAVPDMDVFVWALGKHRAVPDNYDHVEINEARIDWFKDGSNYRQVVTEAMDEADGRAFVTDYAGDAGAVELPALITQRAGLDLGALAATTDAVAFVDAVRALGIFGTDHGRLQRFFARHVPKPPTYAAMPDDEFYRSLALNGPHGAGNIVAASRGEPFSPPPGAALTGLTVDAAEAVKELQETAIQPAKDIVRAFTESPYLTQLYTTMSPEEMEQDPTFVFNSVMEKVANVHQAEAITVCSPDIFREDAPLKIKLADGTSYYATEGTTSQATVIPRPSNNRAQTKVPAARTVMRCGVGAPRTVRDNQSQLAKFLSDLSRRGIALRINTTFGANPRAGAGATVVVTVPFAEQLAQAAQAAHSATSGFGCAGCSSPTRAAARDTDEGPGEGGAYALVLVGFLGYRRWLGRGRGR